MQDINIRIIRNDMNGEERQKNKIMIESSDYLIMNSHRSFFYYSFAFESFKFHGKSRIESSYSE